MVGSEPVGAAESLAEARERFRRGSAVLPDPRKALRSPARYEVEVSERLEALRQRVTQDVVHREVSGG
jgi:hypothetical protein